MRSYGARCHCGLGRLAYNHTYSPPLCIQLINWQIPTTYHRYSQTQGMHKKYRILLTGVVESAYESPMGKAHFHPISVIRAFITVTWNLLRVHPPHTSLPCFPWKHNCSHYTGMAPSRFGPGNTGEGRAM